MFHPPIIVNWFGVFHLFAFHFRTRVICYVLHSQTRMVAPILLPLSYGWSYSPVRYFTLDAYGTPAPLKRRVLGILNLQLKKVFRWRYQEDEHADSSAE